MLNTLMPDRGGPGPAQWANSNAAPFQWMPGGIAFIRRRLLVILGCGIAGLAIGGLYLLLATPKYTAVAILSIDSSRTNPVDETPVMTDWQSQSAYVDSQVALLQSPATLDGVVTQLQLETDPRFAGSGLGHASGISPAEAQARAEVRAETSLSHMLAIARVGATSVIDVQVKTPDPALSATLANAVTSAYMAQQVQAISDTTAQAGTWLQSRVGQLRAQAVAADRAVQEYKAQNNIVDVTAGGGTGLMDEQQLGDLNTELAAARARVAAAEANYEQAESAAASGQTDAMQTDTVPNPVMAGLQQQYLDALRLQADLTSRLGPTHQAVLLQHKAVLELQQSIQAEAAREAAGDKADFAAAVADQQAIQARLSDEIGAEAQTNIQLSELRSLQSTADAYRNIYQNFLQRFTQAMQDQSYPIANARVAAAALPPLAHSSPSGKIALAVGLLLGLMFGLALAVLREALDVSVRSLAQLRGATGLDCLGVIAASPDLAVMANPPLRTKGQGQRLNAVPGAFRAAELSPESGIADAVQSVRVAAARQSARGRDVRVIGCVSAAQGEGCSVFAANLAFAIAADGQRTALVDWNVKSPWLTRMLLQAPNRGLQDLASGAASLDEAAILDPRTGLSFIGQSRGGETGVRAGPAKIRAMLAGLRTAYDVVVIDLPPIQTSSTAMQVSEFLDGLVLVTRWGSTPQAALTGGLARFSPVDAMFLGVVLNRCNPARMKLYASDPMQTSAHASPLPVDAMV